MSVTDALRVLLHGDDECAVVTLQGELTRTTVPFFREVVEQLVHQPGGAPRIELHLDELEHCDSDGADAVTELQRAAAIVGRQLVVSHPSVLARREAEPAAGARIGGIARTG